VDVNIGSLAIGFHLVPLEYFRFCFDQFIPGGMRSTSIDFDHGDAVIHRADPGTKITAYTIFFSNNWPQALFSLVSNFQLFQVENLFKVMENPLTYLIDSPGIIQPKIHDNEDGL